MNGLPKKASAMCHARPVACLALVCGAYKEAVAARKPWTLSRNEDILTQLLAAEAEDAPT